MAAPFLLPLLAGAALGGGGGSTSSASSTAQNANNIAFNPVVNVGTGTTFGRGDANADQGAQSTAVSDNTPKQSAAGGSYIPTDSGFNGGFDDSGQTLKAGFPWWAIGGGASIIGGVYWLRKEAVI